MNMSEIHKCGFCDLLAGLMRRVLCAGTGPRRGSSETGYRELGVGNCDVVRESDTPFPHLQRFPESSTLSSSESDCEFDNRITYNDEICMMFADSTAYDLSGIDMPNKGDFHSLQRRKRRARSCGSRAELVLDDSYPQQVQLLLAKSACWDFDTQLLDAATGGRCLPELSMYLFAGYGLIEVFNLRPENCYKLFSLIEEHYHASNPYHNAIHAADVTQAIHCFLQQQPLSDCMQPLEIMVVLLAAMCHDLDHPGLNHSFLVATQHPLALIFKDKGLGARDRSPMLLRRGRKARKLREQMRDLASARAESLQFSRLDSTPGPSTSSVIAADIYEEEDCQSILEHHHWRVAYSCVLQSGIFEHMPEYLPEIKRMLSSLILATDITRQNDYLNRFKRHLTRKTLDTRRADHRHMVLQMAIKAADISNPGRPWAISKRWSSKVCREFFEQGDQEEKLRLPISHLCNRNTDTVPKIQTGFFRYIVSPLYTEWHRFIKSDLSRTMIKNLVHNEAQWTREDNRSASRTATELSASDTNKISDADQVEYDLETSTNISGSSEMLIASGSETSGFRSRRQSYSPKSCGSVMDVIRRYSAPLHMFTQEPRAHSRSLKRDSIPERAESPVIGQAASTPPAALTPTAVDKQEKEAHNELLQLSEFETEAEVECLIAGGSTVPVIIDPLSTLQKLNRLNPGAFIREDSSTSSGFTPNERSGGNSQRTIHTFTVTTNVRTSSESRLCLSLDVDKPRTASNRTVSSNSEMFKSPPRSVSEDIREVLFAKNMGVRRGSAPAAALCPLQRLASHLTGRTRAASCQRLSVEGTCNARRGSLPIEAMQGISA